MPFLGLGWGLHKVLYTDNKRWTVKEKDCFFLCVCVCVCGVIVVSSIV